MLTRPCRPSRWPEIISFDPRSEEQYVQSCTEPVGLPAWPVVEMLCFVMELDWCFLLLCRATGEQALCLLDKIMFVQGFFCCQLFLFVILFDCYLSFFFLNWWHFLILICWFNWALTSVSFWEFWKFQPYCPFTSFFCLLHIVLICFICCLVRVTG